MYKNLSYSSLTGHQVAAYAQLEIMGLLKQSYEAKESILINISLSLTQFILLFIYF
jgi:hypothetical protein